MEKQFAPYNLALKLKKLGFDEECLGYYRDGKLETIWISPYNKTKFEHIFSKQRHAEAHADKRHSSQKDPCLAPLYQQVFDWFQNTFQLNGEVLRQGIYEPFSSIYWWYMIQDDKGKDLSNWEGRHSKIMDKSYQNVNGNFLNDELFLKYMFEDKFAFKNKNDARKACIEQLIKIAENEKTE